MSMILIVYFIGYVLSILVGYGILLYNNDLNEESSFEIWGIACFWPMLLPISVFGVMVISCEEGAKYLYEKFIKNANARFVNWLNSLKDRHG